MKVFWSEILLFNYKKTYTTKDFIHFQSDATTVVYCIADVIKIFIQDLVNVSLVIEYTYILYKIKKDSKI